MTQHRTLLSVCGLCLMATVLLTTGCAASKHFRSSRNVNLDKTPYVNGKVKTATIDKVGHLPVSVDASQHHLGDAAPWEVIARDVTVFLDKQRWSVPMKNIALAKSEQPEIYVGDRDQGDFMTTSSSEEETSSMMLHYTDPSYKWRDKIKAQCRAKGITHVLVIQVGRGAYRIRQKDWKGGKELVLGTGYKVPVKWLTSLDDPIEVVHFTGALMDSTGHILRAGAEGILSAKSASLLESAIGLGRAVSDKKMNKLTQGVRRKDLAGKPLAYEVALQNLVGNLLKRKGMLIQ